MNPTLILTMLSILPSMNQPKTTTLYPKLTEYCNEAAQQFHQVSDERRILLDDLAMYIVESRQTGPVTNLTFICTHNSRRSHMAQLWAVAAAKYYGIDNIASFSGGTEVSAFNPRAITALEKAGFRITKTTAGSNPGYEASFGPDDMPLPMFSKKFDHDYNPASDFAAVMVCSDADKNCPFVPGADTRIAIPYDDPKAYDETPEAAIMYDERCRQIAIEMLYTMQQVREKTPGN